MESDDFDIDFLRVDNCWQALSFGERQIFQDHPYAPNDHNSGYGHEDWHWNCCTLANGISHRPVPGTVHAVRRRSNSQSQIAVQLDTVIHPTELADHPGVPKRTSLAHDVNSQIPLTKQRSTGYGLSSGDRQIPETCQ